MPGNGNVVEIVHAGPAEMPVGHRKPSRLNDMRRHIQAGAEPQNGAGILGNVGLVEGEVHSMDMVQSAPIDRAAPGSTDSIVANSFGINGLRSANRFVLA